MTRPRAGRPGRRDELEIQLHIERLILNGLDLRHQERFTAALEHELTALLAEGKLPPWVLRSGRLDLEHTRFEAAPGADPETAGAGLARSIAASMRDALPATAADIASGGIGRPGNGPPAEAPPAEAKADGATANAQTPAAAPPSAAPPSAGGGA